MRGTFRRYQRHCEGAVDRACHEPSYEPRIPGGFEGVPVKLIEVAPEELTISKELTRTGSAKSFSERLQASIEEIGLAEPIKVAPLSSGGYLVIDGALRLQA